MRYYIEETNNHEQHAGTKARQDVCDILADQFWKPLTVRKRFGGNTLDKFMAMLDVYSDWRKVARIVTGNDTVLIQYPINTYPRVAPFALPAIRKMKQHGAKIIMLIHDLERLRTHSDVSETKFFALADVVICHNDTMKAILQTYYPHMKIVSLGIFDYLTNEPTYPSNERHGIDIAGNLTPDKSAYVYSLAERFPEGDFHLYGPNFNASAPESKWYEGSFAPEKLPSMLCGEFGLVWDGDSTTTCNGPNGEYLRINNPHKLSLYLASREPVIIWDQAAEAPFVRDNNLGVIAPSIADAIEQMNAMTEDEYDAITESVRTVCAQLRSGHYLTAAVDKALELL